MPETTTYDEPTTDLPDGPFKDWPGAGPTPEPEEEGFRQKIIEIIEARRKRDREEYEQRCEEAKGFYGGTSDPEPEPDPEPDPTDPTYGSTNPTPTTPTPTTQYGSSTPTPGGTTTGYQSGS